MPLQESRFSGATEPIPINVRTAVLNIRFAFAGNIQQKQRNYLGAAGPEKLLKIEGGTSTRGGIASQKGGAWVTTHRLTYAQNIYAPKRGSGQREHRAVHSRESVPYQPGDAALSALKPAKAVPVPALLATRHRLLCSPSRRCRSCVA